MLAAPGPGRAHDIPEEIVLQALVEPVGDRLDVVVRIPLLMLLNLDLPKRGAGFLDLERIEEGLQRASKAAAQEVLFYQHGERLIPDEVRARISPPSDRSFVDRATAVSLIEGPPLPSDSQVFWNQGFFDARFRYPIAADEGGFAIELQVAPGLKNVLRLLVRYTGPDERTHVYDLHYTGTSVALDPGWAAAAWTFVELGYAHILDGADHLLFLLCLVVPFGLRDLRALVGVITAFTLAHSVTLLAAASGLVPQGEWFAPWVELMIAGSIVYLAIENVVGASLRHRWYVTAAFGLIHGFGFSFALQQDMQLAGSHLEISLLAFNVGVELGQLAFLIVCLSVLSLVLRGSGATRIGVVVVSVLVGHTAWHWLLERWSTIERLIAVDEQARRALIVSGALVVLTLVALNVASRVHGKSSRDVRSDGARSAETPRTGLP